MPVEVMQLLHDGVEPGIKNLESAFSAVVQHFTTVYFLVDALDETQDQSKLVSTLMRLVGSQSGNVKILSTSRREPDIDRLLYKTLHISLSNPLVDEDIRLYIREALSQNDRFVGWSESLSCEVENRLIEGAKGM